MWRTLLVEDEPFVRRTIVQLIDWRQMGFEIVGEADDGEEAWEQIQTLQPDLVITDIMMPNMDGLELLRRAKEHGFDGLFVMLTCMNEFEYARQALEYGASGYVLKLSMSPASLHQTLDKVQAALMKQESQRLGISFHQGYEAVWSTLTGHPRLKQSAEIREHPLRPWQASRYRYVAVCSVLHGGERPADSWYAKAFGIREGPETVLHTYSRLGTTTFFCWSLRPLRTQPPSSGELPGPAVYSDFVEEKQFPHVWAQALCRLSPHWYGGRPGLFRLEAAAEEPAVRDALVWKREMELYQWTEAGKQEAAAECLRQAGEEMERSGTPWFTVKELALRIAGNVLQQAPEACGPLQRKLTEASRHHELMHVLKEAVLQFMAEQARTGFAKTDHLEVNAVILYIHEHFEENITVKSLARQVNMDEKYLSGVFAKKTGEPLIQYIQRTRIDKAKHLLTETALPVNEIGEQVGFANANYFFKMFKRWTELTPNEYRKQYGRRFET
ncbi:two-component system, response regulator YesN [Paenibacillus sp. UNCCL117]|uniref:response regulator transcription factor n=1 Tax=unclassified Paenibacillus TaxID=185978 RepID=UPI0008858C4A|nr:MULTISPECIES: response regulator [unclassified Paenibacillus]SDD08060.1 two-component system, response regulator YesN [Paenibacillus sp. cl123]SFW31305.1 two-component system, response regulator YesN [Paenibacillus sp. UNCCL117]